MSEQPVFWLGGKPGNTKDKVRAAPAAEQYEPAIRDACAACGFDLDEYVAAQGGFGGWLAHLERQGNRYRLFWSGKDGLMKLEKALERGGWSELASAETPDEGLPAFIGSLKTLLAANQTES